MSPISSKVEALQQAFSDSLAPFRDKYPAEMLEAFCDYWAAPLQNPKPSQVKAGILLKHQTQETWSLAGRLRTWAKRDSTYLGYQGQYSRAPDGPRVNSRGETRMVESYRKANEAFKALLNPDNNQPDIQSQSKRFRTQDRPSLSESSLKSRGQQPSKPSSRGSMPRKATSSTSTRKRR